MKINHSSLILCLFGCHVKLYLVTAVYAIGQIEGMTIIFCRTPKYVC